uniref:Uncharacterized protein n=1 Tax=Arundo donax TaxID=35708 RepID=A0A0A8ZXR3_ARUDO
MLMIASWAYHQQKPQTKILSKINPIPSLSAIFCNPSNLG